MYYLFLLFLFFFIPSNETPKYPHKFRFEIDGNSVLEHTQSNSASHINSMRQFQLLLYKLQEWKICIAGKCMKQRHLSKTDATQKCLQRFEAPHTHTGKWYTIQFIAPKNQWWLHTKPLITIITHTTQSIYSIWIQNNKSNSIHSCHIKSLSFDVYPMLSNWIIWNWMLLTYSWIFDLQFGFFFSFDL